MDGPDKPGHDEFYMYFNNFVMPRFMRGIHVVKLPTAPKIPPSRPVVTSGKLTTSQALPLPLLTVTVEWCVKPWREELLET